MTREKLIRYVRHLKAVQDVKRKDMRELVSVQVATFFAQLPEDAPPHELADEQAWVRDMIAREFPEGLR